MASGTSGNLAKASSAPTPVRLDGWKDIAAYLGRAERTVKRWEATRGLPIHRVPGGTKPSVYADPIELDQWLESSHASEAALDEPAQDESLEAANFPDVDAKEAIRIPLPGPRLQWTTVVLGLASVAVAIAAVAVSPLPEQIHRLFTRTQAGALATSAASDAEHSRARAYYLKGRYEWSQRTPDSLNRALDLFTQAIVQDPNYAQAYAGLADTYDLLREYSTMPDYDAYPRAIAAAKKAVALDPSLAEAHRALAFAEMYGNWDFADAETEFRRAIELDPKDPQARRWYANAFAVAGRFDESLDQLNIAQELDPTSHSTLADKGSLLANAGRTQEAVEILEEVARSAPDFRSPHAYLMRIGLARGDYKMFLAEGQRTADLMKDSVLQNVIAAARAGHLRGGDRGLLEALYRKQKEYYLTGNLWGTTLAKTCVRMGKKQEALQLLETAYKRHEGEVLTCLAEPALLSLKNEPRFQALEKEINFPMKPPTVSPDYLARVTSQPIGNAFSSH